MAKLKLLNIEIDNLTMAQAVEEIGRLVEQKGIATVVTPNLDHVVMLESDEQFQTAYRNASLVLTDGQPLVWYARMRGTPIVEKVSGSDLFPEVCAMCAKKGYGIYLFGAKEGVAEKAARKLEESYPGIRIVGTESPEYGFEKKPELIEKYARQIREAAPDILAVALGSPKGEKFLEAHKHELGVPVSMSIGATIDFIAGQVRRAPRWMSRCGLEWLFRVTQDPKRLAKRYWNDFWKMHAIMRKYRKQR